MPEAEHDTQKRRPRFRRSERSPSFQVTERDVEIVHQVARHRFLRSTHISQLLNAPHKKVCERLSSLYHAGYLDRPCSQIEYHVRGGGSEPYVYSLDNRGARLLKDSGRLDRIDSAGTCKERGTTRRFLLHTLAVTEFRVALALACRTRPGLRLVEPDELLNSAPETTRQEANPWRWRVRVHFNGQTSEVGVIPDYVFALVLPDGRRRPFFVECDRGTMPIARKSLTQTSILRKLLAYEASYRQGVHASLFGWKRFRTLVVTTVDERITNMVALSRTTPAVSNSNLFLFGRQVALYQSSPIHFEWLSQHGAFATLA